VRPDGVSRIAEERQHRALADELARVTTVFTRGAESGRSIQTNMATDAFGVRVRASGQWPPDGHEPSPRMRPGPARSVLSQRTRGLAVPGSVTESSTSFIGTAPQLVSRAR
jgi:hypothetical protein